MCLENLLAQVSIQVPLRWFFLLRTTTLKKKGVLRYDQQSIPYARLTPLNASHQTYYFVLLFCLFIYRFSIY